MWEQTLAIFLVLGLLTGSLWLLRRKGFASVNFRFTKGLSGTRRMQLLERMVLTPHHSLHLIRVENRTLLVGVSPQNCALVDSFGAASNQTAWTTGPDREGV